MATPDGSLLPPVVERALRLAARGHHGQLRKGAPAGCEREGPPLPEGCVPYVAHPVAAAMILLRAGAPDVAVAAALLHDYLEDVPDPDGAERIRREAGEEVLSVVRELTEDKRPHLPPEATWARRKAETVARVASLSGTAALVRAADALHNLISLAAELAAAADPGAVWARFNAPREAQLEHLTALVGALRRRLGEDHPLAAALADALARVTAAG